MLDNIAYYSILNKFAECYLDCFNSLKVIEYFINKYNMKIYENIIFVLEKTYLLQICKIFYRFTKITKYSICF